eukprot:TRINITY_DN9573_c0_g1_i1.p2 TRINITY_DN9573_c0_g1~~TRINITY_DN9573_c0_g1_i1.p2  ORF type:complete len:104 (+),score=21.47 TRINITY_DN9573_c0_g1_i1:164-475(+)
MMCPLSPPAHARSGSFPVTGMPPRSSPAMTPRRRSSSLQAGSAAPQNARRHSSLKYMSPRRARAVIAVLLARLSHSSVRARCRRRGRRRAAGSRGRQAPRAAP